MNTSRLKKTLLAGTALVAVGAYIPAAINQAHAADLTLTANGAWALGGAGGAGGAVAGDNVDLNTFALSIFGNGVSDDGSGLGIFTIGDITDSSVVPGPFSDVSILDNGGFDATVTIGSIDIGDTFSVSNNDAQDVSLIATVTGNVTVGENIRITNAEVGTVQSVSLTIEGDVVVGDDIIITVVDGTAAHNARLTLNGNVTVGGQITLSDPAAGSDAIVIFGGSGAATQVINANIISQTGGDGRVWVENISTGGIIFNNSVGFSAASRLDSVSVSKDGNNQIVTFADDVHTVNGILLGNNAGADVITANFGGAADTAISGALIGGAAETINVNIIGGNIVTQSNAWTGIDALTISGNTAFDSQADITATITTIDGPISVLNIANTSATALTGITTSLLNGGTLRTSAASTITGQIVGDATGTLDIDADTTLTSSVSGLGAIDVATGTALTMGPSGFSLAANTITLNGTGALNLTGSFLFGNIVAAADGDGVITYNNAGGADGFITGDIGTSAASIGNITFVDHADADGVRVSGDLFVDVITLGENDTLTFRDFGGAPLIQSVSGAIEAINNNGAGIVLGGGASLSTTTFNGIIGGNSNIDDLTVLAGSMAIFNNNADFDGALLASGSTIQVNEGFTLTADTQTDANITTWNIGVNNTGGTQTHGEVFFTGDNVDLSNDTVNFVVNASSGPLTAGVGVLIDVFGGNQNAVIAGATVTDNSFFYDFELVAATNFVNVTIVQAVVLADIVDTQNNANIGEVLLNELAGSTDPEINQIQANLGAATNAKELNDILEASGPTVDNGVIAGAMAITNGALNIATGRLASLRKGTESGVSTGNLSEGTQIWMQAFGAEGTQDRRNNIDGFDVSGRGLAFGIDTQNLSEDTVIGLAFSYGNAVVASKNANNTVTGIKSSQITLYSDHDIDERTYISTRLAYAWNDVDTIRFNVGGIAGLNAVGSYNANQLSARAEVGRSYDYDGTIVTPSLMANYVRFNLDSYTEMGAGGANLIMAARDVSIFELGVGVDISHDYQQADGGIVTPALHIAYRHDLVGDMAVINSGFVAGGSTFTTTGFTPAQGTLDVGISVSYAQTNNWQLTANYNFEYKSDYEAHSGSVRAAYKF